MERVEIHRSYNSSEESIDIINEVIEELDQIEKVKIGIYNVGTYYSDEWEMYSLSISAGASSGDALGIGNFFTPQANLTLKAIPGFDVGSVFTVTFIDEQDNEIPMGTFIVTNSMESDDLGVVDVTSDSYIANKLNKAFSFENMNYGTFGYKEIFEDDESDNTDHILDRHYASNCEIGYLVQEIKRQTGIDVVFDERFFEPITEDDNIRWFRVYFPLESQSDDDNNNSTLEYVELSCSEILSGVAALFGSNVIVTGDNKAMLVPPFDPYAIYKYHTFTDDEYDGSYRLSEHPYILDSVEYEVNGFTQEREYSYANVEHYDPEAEQAAIDEYYEVSTNNSLKNEIIDIWEEADREYGDDGHVIYYDGTRVKLPSQEVFFKRLGRYAVRSIGKSSIRGGLTIQDVDYQLLCLSRNMEENAQEILRSIYKYDTLFVRWMPDSDFITDQYLQAAALGYGTDDYNVSVTYNESTVSTGKMTPAQSGEVEGRHYSFKVAVPWIGAAIARDMCDIYAKVLEEQVHPPTTKHVAQSDSECTGDEYFAAAIKATSYRSSPMFMDAFRKPQDYYSGSFDFAGYHPSLSPGEIIHLLHDDEEKKIYVGEVTYSWDGSLNVSVTSPFNADIDAENDGVVAGGSGGGAATFSAAQAAALSTMSINGANIIAGTIPGISIEDGAINLDHVNKAFIRDLTADTAFVNNLTANTAFINKLTASTAFIDDLIANNAYLEKLTASEGFIGDLTANTAFIEELTSKEAFIESAVISELRGDIADYKQIIVGQLDATSIAAKMADLGYALIGDGTVDSAIIIREYVGHSTILDLNTKFINVVSDSGNLKLKDNTLQITDNNKVVRVQIGEDASEDYNLYLWDSSGNLTWDAQGLTAKGITRKIIKDNMVADDAGINGGKIDMQSLFTSMNGSSYTLSSSILNYDPDNMSLESKFQTVTDEINLFEAEGGVSAYVTISGHARDDGYGHTLEYAVAELHVQKEVFVSQKGRTVKQDITSDLLTIPVWTRYSDDEQDDTIWNNQHRSGIAINLTTSDVKYGATFKAKAAYAIVDGSYQYIEAESMAYGNTQVSTKWSSIEENIDSITSTVGYMSTDISNIEGSVENIDNYLNNHKSDINSISQIRQTADAGKAEVELLANYNSAGALVSITAGLVDKIEKSNIKLKADQITLDGNVVMKADLVDGTTTISGSNIKTGNIDGIAIHGKESMFDDSLTVGKDYSGGKFSSKVVIDNNTIGAYIFRNSMEETSQLNLNITKLNMADASLEANDGTFENGIESGSDISIAQGYKLTLNSSNLGLKYGQKTIDGTTRTGLIVGDLNQTSNASYVILGSDCYARGYLKVNDSMEVGGTFMVNSSSMATFNGSVNLKKPGSINASNTYAVDGSTVYNYMSDRSNFMEPTFISQVTGSSNALWFGEVTDVWLVLFLTVFYNGENNKTSPNYGFDEIVITRRAVQGDNNWKYIRRGSRAQCFVRIQIKADGLYLNEAYCNGNDCTSTTRVVAYYI